MDQLKTGKLLKELRHEKQMTQEQLAKVFNVSSRSISRWETGINLPDISLLVEIADFFGVDVREIIEGERKSEMMDTEVREVAEKMAEYANTEKSKLLRVIQIISFVGVLIMMLSIFLQTFNTEPEEIKKGAVFFSIIALVIMAIITLFVTGLLERIIKHKRFLKGIKIITIIVLIIGALRPLMMVGLVGILLVGSALEKPEVYDDVTHYNEYMSFSRNNGEYNDEENKWNKLGMDEHIWPDRITPEMNVADYKMVYYNPWDAQYLGYLVVDYDADTYAKEVQRLKDYESTEYVGYYSVKEETTYELLAINADSYNGFVYALTDGESRIIYAEQLFCNYFMDLDYKKYMPEEYFLDGFDATSDNPDALERRKEIEKHSN